MSRLDGRLARYALWALVLLGLFLFPWPGVGAEFSRGFCGIANGLLGDLRWHSIVAIEFQPDAEIGAEARALKAAWSVAVMVRDTQAGVATPAFTLDLRSLAYTPWSVLFALALASPNRGTVVWIRSQLLGLALVGGFVLLSIALTIMWMLSHVWIADPTSLLAGERVHLVALGAAGQWVIGALHGAVAAMGGPAAGLLWMLAWKVTAPVGSWPWSGTLFPGSPQKRPQPRGIKGSAKAGT